MMLTHVVPMVNSLDSVHGGNILVIGNRLQNPKPYYSEFPDSLKVLESAPYVNAQPVAGLAQFMCDSRTLSESGNSL